MADKEIVIDLETGNTPSNKAGRRDLVAILSVGIVVFDPEKLNTFEELREWRTVYANEEKPSKQYIGENAFYTPV